MSSDITCMGCGKMYHLIEQIGPGRIITTTQTVESDGYHDACRPCLKCGRHGPYSFGYNCDYVELDTRLHVNCRMRKIFIACASGDIRYIEAHVNAENINVRCHQYKERQNVSALYVAVRSRQYKVIEFLLKHGARTSIRDFICACDGKHIPTIRLFLQANVNIDEVFMGATPLMRMAQFGDLDVASILVAYGAEIDILNENGYSALAIGARSSGCPMPPSVPKNHYGVCEFLIAMGASRDIKSMWSDGTYMTSAVLELLQTPLSLQRLCHYHIWVQSLKS